MTAQRRVVAEVLDGEHVHLSADEVLDRAQRRLPEISLATIYNTLNELVAMGEIGVFRGVEGSLRYDPNADRHHHLLCDTCAAIFDVTPKESAGVELDELERRGFRVDRTEVVFHGRCPRCQ